MRERLLNDYCSMSSDDDMSEDRFRLLMDAITGIETEMEAKRARTRRWWLS